MTAGAPPPAPPQALALPLPWLTVDAADSAVLQEVNHTPQLLYDFPWPHVEKLAFLVRVRGLRLGVGLCPQGSLADACPKGH